MNKFRLLFSKIYRFFFPLEVIDMYRRMGVKIGKGGHLGFDVVLDFSHYWLIEIGDEIRIGPGTHILAHDGSTKNHIGYTRIGRVIIGNNVFIGSGSIVLPGVTIGDNCVIGAGSVISKSIPANSVAVGNPCKVVGTLEDYVAKLKKQMEESPVFGEEYTLRGNLTKERKREMIEKLANQQGFVI